MNQSVGVQSESGIMGDGLESMRNWHNYQNTNDGGRDAAIIIERERERWMSIKDDETHETQQIWFTKKEGETRDMSETKLCSRKHLNITTNSLCNS